MSKVIIFRMLLFSSTPNSKSFNILRTFTLSISIPPNNKIDVVLTNFDKIFKKNSFSWVTYLSATSVYGDKKGKWVDEESDPIPTSDRGIDRLNAENNWLKYYRNFNLPLQIFRLSGIYSNENNVLNRLKKNNVRIVEIENQIFSRVHVEDIANILHNSFSSKKILKGEVSCGSCGKVI